MAWASTTPGGTLPRPAAHRIPPMAALVRRSSPACSGPAALRPARCPIRASRRRRGRPPAPGRHGLCVTGAAPCWRRGARCADRTGALLPHNVVGKKRVVLPCEDVDLVVVGQRLREALGVDFGPSVVAHRIAVDNLQDSHGCHRSTSALGRSIGRRAASKPTRGPAPCVATVGLTPVALATSALCGRSSWGSARRSQGAGEGRCVDGKVPRWSNGGGGGRLEPGEPRSGLEHSIRSRLSLR